MFHCFELGNIIHFRNEYIFSSLSACNYIIGKPKRAYTLLEAMIVMWLFTCCGVYIPC